VIRVYDEAGNVLERPRVASPIALQIFENCTSQSPKRSVPLFGAKPFSNVLCQYMKSALLAAIFGITGLVAILAVSAEEKASVIQTHPPKWFPDYGEPVVPQIEEVPPPEVVVPEPLGHYYSVAEAKAEKPAPRRHIHVVRPRPNFFEKLVTGFIKLQKPQTGKSFRKRSRTTLRRG
jgi:hypothetical protein